MMKKRSLLFGFVTAALLFLAAGNVLAVGPEGWYWNKTGGWWGMGTQNDPNGMHVVVDRPKEIGSPRYVSPIPPNGPLIPVVGRGQAFRVNIESYHLICSNSPSRMVINTVNQWNGQKATFVSGVTPAGGSNQHYYYARKSMDIVITAPNAPGRYRLNVTVQDQWNGPLPNTNADTGWGVYGEIFGVITFDVEGPQGMVDTVNCDTISGWSCDARNPEAAVANDIYIGPNIGDRRYSGVTGMCDNTDGHRFSLPVPDSAKTGTSHTVAVYANGINGGQIKLPFAPGVSPVLSCAQDIRNTIVTLKANKTTIAPNEQVTFEWSSADVPPTGSCWAGNNGHSAWTNPTDPAKAKVKNTTGTDTFAVPESRTYEIFCDSYEGTPRKASVPITVVAMSAPTSVDAVCPAPGKSVKVSWSAPGQNTFVVVATHGQTTETYDNVTGSNFTLPFVATPGQTYSIAVHSKSPTGIWSPAGTDSVQCTPANLAEPVITFYANPSTVQSGQTTELNWSATNATYCLKLWMNNADFASNRTISGKANSAPLQVDTTFQIFCVNDAVATTIFDKIKGAVQRIVTKIAGPSVDAQIQNATCPAGAACKLAEAPVKVIASAGPTFSCTDPAGNPTSSGGRDICVHSLSGEWDDDHLTGNVIWKAVDNRASCTDGRKCELICPPGTRANNTSGAVCEPVTDCVKDGVTVKYGETIRAYKNRSWNIGEGCVYQIQTCRADGTFTGSNAYIYSACVPEDEPGSIEN